MGFFSSLFTKSARCIACCQTVAFTPVLPRDYRFVAFQDVPTPRKYATRPPNDREGGWIQGFPRQNQPRFYELLIGSILGSMNNAHTRTEVGKDYFLCGPCILKYARPAATSTFKEATRGGFFHPEHFLREGAGKSKFYEIWGAAEIGVPEALDWVFDTSTRLKSEAEAGFSCTLVGLVADSLINGYLQDSRLSAETIKAIEAYAKESIRPGRQFTEYYVQYIDAFLVVKDGGRFSLSVADLTPMQRWLESQLSTLQGDTLARAKQGIQLIRKAG